MTQVSMTLTTKLTNQWFFVTMTFKRRVSSVEMLKVMVKVADLFF